MKAEIDEKGILNVTPVTETERVSLEKWYDENPVSEDDGIKLNLECK
jgi:hypothetical protein